MRMATTKRIIPGVFDELVEVDVYQDKHRPEKQEKVGQGYPLNPVLRDNFWNTPNAVSYTHLTLPTTPYV